MSLTSDKLQLSNQIKAVILNFYGQLPRSQLHEKVLKQIIPVLITLFMDNLDNQQSMKKNNNSIQGNQNILKNLNFMLNGQKQNFNPMINTNNNTNLQLKYQAISIFSKKQKREQVKDKIKIDIQKFLSNCQDLSVEDIIKKTLAICKMYNCLLSTNAIKESYKDMFLQWNLAKLKKIQSIQWFNKYSQSTKIKRVILKFSQKYRLSVYHLQASKVLHKFYVLKLKNYYSTFLNSLTCSFSHAYISQNQKFQKLKTKMRQKGLSIIERKFYLCLNNSFFKLKRFRIFSNPWVKIWIRSIVYKTNANFQTSFWRLKNFSQKVQNDQNTHLQNNLLVEDFRPNNLLKSSKKNQQKGRGSLQTQKLLQTIDHTSKVEANLFTRVQKAQILWNNIQNIDKLFTLGLIIQAFSALQSYESKSVSPISSKEAQEQIIQNIEIDSQKIQDFIKQSVRQDTQKKIQRLTKKLVNLE